VIFFYKSNQFNNEDFKHFQVKSGTFFGLTKLAKEETKVCRQVKVFDQCLDDP